MYIRDIAKVFISPSFFMCRDFPFSQCLKVVVTLWSCTRYQPAASSLVIVIGSAYVLGTNLYCLGYLEK